MRLSATPLMLTIMLLTACTTQTTVVPSDDLKNQLFDSTKTWQLTQIDNQDIPSNIEVSLHFDETGKATGKLACNNFFGQSELTAERFTITNLATTRKLCAETENNYELMLSKLLQAGADIQLQQQKLTLKGEKTLLFQQVD